MTDMDRTRRIAAIEEIRRHAHARGVLWGLGPGVLIGAAVSAGVFGGGWVLVAGLGVAAAAVLGVFAILAGLW